MTGADEIRGLADRLRDLADQLGAPDLTDERAAELAREAAELLGRAGNEIDRALHEGDSDEA
jgi:hypothetical protein